MFDAEAGVSREDSSYHPHLIHNGSLALSDPVLPFICSLRLKFYGLLLVILITVAGKSYKCILLTDQLIPRN